MDRQTGSNCSTGTCFDGIELRLTMIIFASMLVFPGVSYGSHVHLGASLGKHVEDRIQSETPPMRWTKSIGMASEINMLVGALTDSMP